jgi:purine-nucleoside phosphorylase
MTQINTDLNLHLQATVAAICEAIPNGFRPEIALILGTGLGTLASLLEVITTLEYADLPHFPKPTTDDHEGKLILGLLAGKKTVVFQGRLHVYEGFSASEVTYPIRVAKALGVTNLIVTNIAGGLNTHFKLGDIMTITDHINLMGVNPLIGKHHESMGPRFPDMSQPYHRDLLTLVRKCAHELNIPLQKGVYAAMTGPSLETAAEYRMLRILGADAIGMSTVPEVIVAAQVGLRVLGLTLISDICDPDHLEPMDLPRLFAVVGEAEPKITQLVRAVVSQLE